MNFEVSRSFIAALGLGLIAIMFSCTNQPKASSVIDRGSCVDSEHGRMNYLLCKTETSAGDTSLTQFILKIKDQRYANGPLSALSQEQYSRVVDYYSFQFKKDVQLICDDHIEEPVIVSFVRHFNSSPFIEFSIWFDLEGSENVSECVVQINDVVFKNGLIKFKVNN